MHAFWLVLTYDLLEDRRIDDVIIKTFLNSLLYKTNRFQVDETHGNLESICLLNHASHGKDNLNYTSKSLLEYINIPYLHVRLIEPTHSLRARCTLRRSLSF